MNQKKKEFIETKIRYLEEGISEFVATPHQFLNKAEGELFDRISEVCKILSIEIPSLTEGLRFVTGTGVSDANSVIGTLQYFILGDNDEAEFEKADGLPIIFLSHKSDDKRYADPLRDLIVGLGIKNDQLIYTSHPMHKIPMDRNIYDYLRDAIYGNVFVVILWSNAYLKSPACLNEMGAAWVAQKNYTNVYTPDFDFGNPQYHECAVDTRKMGAVLNGNENCKASILEFKNKIVSLFDLEVDEASCMYLIDNFIKSIKELS